MTNTADICVPADLSNPGQFFACCGLLELADRLWPSAAGWFDLGGPGTVFRIATRPDASLEDLLACARSVEFDVRGEEGGDDDGGGPIEPIVVRSPIKLVLDWWSDKSIKPWAGSMNERLILGAMLRAIDTTKPDPFNDFRVVRDPKTRKKREPFYFDCRRGSNAHPLDSGFSPDTQEMESDCCPAVEALCFIGLQRARPVPTGRPNQSRYTVWTDRLPANAIAPVVCGLVAVSNSPAFTFDNFFRTDQRKHKAFSRATCERNKNA
jgi:hypothetical protein